MRCAPRRFELPVRVLAWGIGEFSERGVSVGGDGRYRQPPGWQARLLLHKQVIGEIGLNCRGKAVLQRDLHPRAAWDHHFPAKDCAAALFIDGGWRLEALCVGELR